MSEITGTLPPPGARAGADAFPSPPGGVGPGNLPAPPARAKPAPRLARLPDWPRTMRRDTAASYCDLSVNAFEREVIEGRLPAPILLGGTRCWSRPALDRCLDRLTGEVAEDWRARSPLYAAR